MSAKGVVLSNSSALALGTVNGTAVFWAGGRGCLVVNASAYGVGTILQIQGPGGGWIQANSGNITADLIQALDLPAGQLRMALAGSSVGVSAVFAGVTYT